MDKTALYDIFAVPIFSGGKLVPHLRHLPWVDAENILISVQTLFRKGFATDSMPWYHNRVQLSYGIIGNVHFFW